MEELEGENGDMVGGYLMIKANDLNHAVQLAQDCPAIAIDGNIEVREIMPMEAE